jgi:hypothetical protein
LVGSWFEANWAKNWLYPSQKNKTKQKKQAIPSTAKKSFPFKSQV